MRHLFCGLMITLVGPAFAFAAGVGPTYSKDVAPFLKKYCVDCHNSNKAKAGFDLETYDSLVGEGKKGRAMAKDRGDRGRRKRDRDDDD